MTTRSFSKLGALTSFFRRTTSSRRGSSSSLTPNSGSKRKDPKTMRWTRTVPWRSPTWNPSGASWTKRVSTWFLRVTTRWSSSDISLPLHTWRWTKPAAGPQRISANSTKVTAHRLTLLTRPWSSASWTLDSRPLSCLLSVLMPARWTFKHLRMWTFRLSSTRETLPFCPTGLFPAPTESLSAWPSTHQSETSPDTPTGVCWPTGASARSHVAAEPPPDNCNLLVYIFSLSFLVYHF